MRNIFQNGDLYCRTSFGSSFKMFWYSGSALAQLRPFFPILEGHIPSWNVERGGFFLLSPEIVDGTDDCVSFSLAFYGKVVSHLL